MSKPRPTAQGIDTSASDSGTSGGKLRVPPGHFAFVGLIVVFAISYHPVLAAISKEWLGNGPYSHGYLALLIAMYLVWEKREFLGTIEEQHNWPAVITILIAGLAGWFATLVSVQLVQIYSLIVLVVASIVAIYGWNAVRELRIALLTLLLVMPVWNLLQIPLQEISSSVTFIGLKIFGIPILREGFRFTVPGGQFIIEEACSGLGFFLTSLLLGLLYVQFNRIKGIQYFLFILFAITLALVSNWIRILVIMIVGNYTQMDHVIVQDHLTFGWILFSIMLIPFFVVGHYFVVAEPANKNVVANNKPRTKPSKGVSYQQYITLLIATIALTAFPVLGWFYGNMSSSAHSTNNLPKLFSPVMELSNNQNNLDWFPNYSGASHQVLQRYVYKNQDFLCLIIQYNDQKQGAELIGVNNILYSEDRWRLENKESASVKFSDTDVAHNTLLLTNRAGTRALAYWYLIGGRVTANPIIAKIYGLLGSLSGNDSAYLIGLAVDSSNRGEDNSFNLLLELSSALQIELSENLREK